MGACSIILLLPSVWQKLLISRWVHVLLFCCCHLSGKNVWYLDECMFYYSVAAICLAKTFDISMGACSIILLLPSVWQKLLLSRWVHVLLFCCCHLSGKNFWYLDGCMFYYSVAAICLAKTFDISMGACSIILLLPSAWQKLLISRWVHVLLFCCCHLSGKNFWYLDGCMFYYSVAAICLAKTFDISMGACSIILLLPSVWQKLLISRWVHVLLFCCCHLSGKNFWYLDGCMFYYSVAAICLAKTFDISMGACSIILLLPSVWQKRLISRWVHVLLFCCCHLSGKSLLQKCLKTSCSIGTHELGWTRNN